MIELFARIAATFPRSLVEPVRAVLVGGAAVHLHTQRRVSADAEALFARRVLLPQDLVLEWRDEHDRAQILAYDYNYFGELGLLHPDAVADAWEISEQPDPAVMTLCVLAPVDLVVSKLARWGAQDRDDVDALLAGHRVSAQVLRARGDEALSYYVGDDRAVRARLDLLVDALSTRADQ